MKIQESAENYLETILMIGQRKPHVRSIDIATELEVSKPSVSVAMKNLRENGYIRMDSSNFVEVYDGNIENIPEEYRIQSPNVCTRPIPSKAEVNKEVAR